MATGVSIRNSAQRVVISNQQYGLVFVGNAQFTGERKPIAYLANSGDIPTPGTDNPYYIYRINCAYPPMAFLQMLSPQRFAICSIRSLGGLSWEIVVSGANWTVIPIVKCFCRLSGPGRSGLVGMRIRDAQGNRTWDSTEKMLVIRRKLDWPSYRDASTGPAVQSQAMTGIAAPYLMSCSSIGITARNSARVNGVANYRITVYSLGWTYFDGQLSRLTRATQAYQYWEDGPVASNSLAADRTYIIEGNDY